MFARRAHCAMKRCASGKKKTTMTEAPFTLRGERKQNRSALNSPRKCPCSSVPQSRQGATAAQENVAGAPPNHQTGHRDGIRSGVRCAGGLALVAAAMSSGPKVRNGFGARLCVPASAPFPLCNRSLNWLVLEVRRRSSTHPMETLKNLGSFCQMAVRYPDCGLFPSLTSSGAHPGRNRFQQ